MADIIDIADARAKDGWTQGPLLCTWCRWLFRAVFPADTERDLVCPSCGAVGCLERVDYERDDVVIIYDTPNQPRDAPV